VATERPSKALTEKPRKGRAAKGTTAISAAARRTTTPSALTSGRRSATRPPIQ
jgi:hypothetical protein